MMIAVAIVAASFGLHSWVERMEATAENYRMIAAIHAWAQELHTNAKKYDGMCMGWAAPAPFRPNPALDPKLAAYHASMRRKYERAARFPWKFVEPDPPRPR